MWGWLKGLFRKPSAQPAGRSFPEQEQRTLDAFSKHFGLRFNDRDLLRLALTHRSYLSVTKGARASNERLEFLGDSVLGLVTSEYLFRRHPDEHEGQLTKTKSLLVSKAILSRRALAMGLGRFVLMSHSEIESGGRQRLSIVADAFESVVGAIYLDLGFEASRAFIDRWLLSGSGEIVADKAHTNYKSYLQEYVQSTFRTHPVYRIRREVGPDHSKQFHVEVIVGRRTLGSGTGLNKKEAEQAAARDALERVESPNPVKVDPRTAEERGGREGVDATASGAEEAVLRRRGRRGGRGRRPQSGAQGVVAATPRQEDEVEAPDFEAAELAMSEFESPSDEPSREPTPVFQTPTLETRDTSPIQEPRRIEPRVALGTWEVDEEFEEIGRPEGPLEDLHIDLYGFEPETPIPTPAALDPPPIPIDEPRRQVAGPPPEDEGQEKSGQEAGGGEARGGGRRYGRRGRRSQRR